MQHSPIELLIIDDSPEDRQIVRDLLEPTQRSYTVREARTAAEGVAEFARKTPDCVLLDYNLPDADGLSCLDDFKGKSGELSCAVILLTGTNNRQLTNFALTRGVQDYLPKSHISTHNLERAIDHALVRCKLVGEREEATRALADSERLLRMAQDAAGIGTFSWNLQTDETSFGGAYFSLYGLDPNRDQMSFEEWLSLIHPEDRERIRTETERAIITGGQFNYEYRVIWPDRSEHWQLGRGAVIRDDEGRALRLTGVNLDVTASKSLQHALVLANDELRHFAYAASHDLQAPLRSVSVFAELLERTLGPQVDEKARQALTFVRSSSERMQLLVSDLLTYAQSGSSSGIPSQLIPLHDALRTAVENLNSEIVGSGAVITFEDDLPAVRSTSGELTQLFQNLIGNAISYRQSGVSPVIHVSAKYEARRWVISVRDNGKGFAMTHASLIFQPFQRLADSHVPGTGLGLPICKRIVERLGGAIWAESTPGQGSTFSFTFPSSAVARAS